MKISDFFSRISKNGEKNTHEIRSLEVKGGTAAPLTLSPSAQEEAAREVLESLEPPSRASVQQGDDSYHRYKALAERVSEQRTAKAFAAMRCVAYCEQELGRKHRPKKEQKQDVKQAWWKRGVKVSGDKGAKLGQEVCQLSAISGLPMGRTADVEIWEELEHELYAVMDIVQLTGGELERRWKECLAETTVKRLKPAMGND